MRLLPLRSIGPLLLMASASLNCWAEDPIFSGPQVGESLPPFSVVAVYGTDAGAEFVVTVDYDPAVTHAQTAGTNVIEHGGRAAEEVRMLWDAVSTSLSPSPHGEVLNA